MKRTATTLALLAGFGGGCMSPNGKATSKNEPPATGHFNRASTSKPIPGVVGPTGEPVSYGARGATPGDAPGTAKVGGSQVQPAGLLHKSAAEGCADCAHVPSLHNVGSRVHGAFSHLHGQNGAMYNTAGTGGPGILPVPGMGPPGAVAAVGAINPMMMQQPTNQRSSIKFVSPAGMRIGWLLPGGQFTPKDNDLTAQASYNFLQGQVYRLRLSSILPGFPGKTFYPTMEVVTANPKTMRFLAHSTVPVGFTNEDFEQANAGNMVVKVIYLPDREFADFATVGGAEEIVSTRLDPGADPIAEAQRRGSILAIITLGNIDLENTASPQMNQMPSAPMMPPVPGMKTMVPTPVPPLAMPSVPTAEPIFPKPLPSTTTSVPTGAAKGAPATLPTLPRK